MLKQVVPYIRLMRLDKPVGIWLLWWPVCWAILLAAKGTIPFMMTLYFFLGTIIMRTAGCIINDMADVSFDKHVARTQFRPLTSGQVSFLQASIILLILLLLALCILLALPRACIPYAFFALFITGLYPFCKRFFAAPQCVLGVAFSMGIPMVYVALGHPFDKIFFVLMGLNYLWIVAYDTLYAISDVEDDKKIGVYSTARLFGSYAKTISLGILSIVHVSWFLIMFRWDPFFYWGMILSTSNLIYQIRLVMTKDDAFRAFQINAWYGLFLAISLL